ncbi:dihydrolipoyl dehydrogenase family protein [Cetobacterium sp.]|uniref:dihydrolipoyl dehydrogenase family protein n=1 Tax=Cetobacterium sp. TaxID=2071632 RepID=UPI003F2E83C4
MYNTIVIGGGAGGLTVSIALASAGKKVLLIEKEQLGGECTWGGCIPSKSFISASKKTSNLKDALDKVIKNVHKVGDAELPYISKFENIEYVKGEGTFVDKNTVSVNGKIYKSKYIVVSTGSLPFIPNIKGIKNSQYFTNQDFFYSKDNYKSIVMLGAGVISLELAFPLKKLGIEVTIIEKSEFFLPTLEKEIREFYIQKLKEAKIKLFLNCTSIEIDVINSEKIEKEIIVRTNNGDFKTEKIFVSTGRISNIDNLKLENAEINYNQKEIIVDKYMRTSTKNIFAIGDVASEFKFSHVAGYQGEIVVRNILFPYILKKVDYSYIPWTLFGDIEVSKVGLSEEVAKQKFKKIYVYTIDKENDRSVIAFEQTFLLKVICDSKFNIIGVVCIGERAGEIVGILQVMIGNKIKLYKGLNSIQAYPTYAYYIRNLSKRAYVDYLKSFMNMFHN